MPPDRDPALSEEDFKRLVDRALRNSLNDEGLQALHSDLDRWWSVLSAMKKSVETQLAAKRDEVRAQRVARQGRKATEDDAEAEEAYAGWRASSVRFKNIVEAELLRVGLLRARQIPERYREQIAEERNYWAHRAKCLEQAIRRHHDESADAPSDVDLDLWSLIDQ